MINNLKSYRKQNCVNFLKELFNLRESLNTNRFHSALNKVHMSMSILLNSFQNNFSKLNSEMKLERINSMRNDDIKEYNYGNIFLFVFNEIIVDVVPDELADLFVNKKIKDVEQTIFKLMDYDKRSCDKCGQYFLKPFFETPKLRVQKEDFCLAFHEGCIMFD